MAANKGAKRSLARYAEYAKNPNATGINSFLATDSHFAANSLINSMCK